MTPDEIAAVAKTIELLAKYPPKTESWSHPGEPTLADTLRAWLKEAL